MTQSLSDLTNEIKTWLSDKDFLDKVRHFLGGAGLSDSKVANWEKRGLPDTLVEGVALYHCSERGRLDFATAEMTGLSGKLNWQVFLVSGQADERGFHQSKGLKLWSEVKQHGRSTHAKFMTHTIRTSLPSFDDISITDLLTQEPFDKDSIRIQPIVNPSRPEEPGLECELCWEIEPDTISNIGFYGDFPGEVPKTTPDGEHIYFGGSTNIPVEELYLMACIPINILETSTDLLDDNPFKRARCIRFPKDSLYTGALDDFLDQKRDRKWVTPWFGNLGVVPTLEESEGYHWQKEVEKFIETSGIQISPKTHVTFLMKIESPAPYLHYAIVFENQKGEPSNS